MDFACANLLRDAGFEPLRRRRGRRDRRHPLRRLDRRAAGAADALCPQEAQGLRPRRPDRGRADRGQRVLLVEDLTTDGGSKLRFAEAIRAAGGEVAHTFVVFYYGIFPQTVRRPRRPRPDAALSRHLARRAGRGPRRRPFRRRHARRGRGLPRRSAAPGRRHGGVDGRGISARGRIARRQKLR